jgi:hypothetical protein
MHYIDLFKFSRTKTVRIYWAQANLALETHMISPLDLSNAGDIHY